MEVLRRGATATTDDCVMLDGNGQRPVVRLDGATMNASRAVWLLVHGDPGDDWVLHTCHRGWEGCINIRHLYLGDHDQNMIDKVEAERQARGEINGWHKLTEEQVREIRRRYVFRHPVNGGRALAAEFNVCESTISSVVNRRSWAWLADG
ncbi:hypothetical protein ACIQMV_39060 [Streptomyces sp. NPDC091412]|uniref:hypothetical protein n=1 Tax=Streptomyces sp. NPDC091412 TaxID=3366002 RepID=UPI003830133E